MSKIRVGDKNFSGLSIKGKIRLLVERGYKQAAFRLKRNAVLFAEAWAKGGYKARLSRSSGPVTEGGFQKNAYYVVVSRR